MIILGLAILASVVWLFDALVIPWQTDTMIQKARNICYYMQRVSPDLTTPQEQTLLEHLQGYEKDLSYLLIEDRNGKALAHSNPLRVGMIFNDPGTLAAAREGRRIEQIYTRDADNPHSPYHGERVVDILLPNYDRNGRLIGAVNVGLGLKRLDEARNRYYGALTLGSVIFVLILFAITSWLFATVVNPIKSMAATTKAFEEGDMNARIPFSRCDEVGVLADEFNSMAERIAYLLADLRKRQRDLQDYVNKLTTLNAKIAVDGSILLVNDAAVKLAGKPTEQLIGKKFWDTPWWKSSTILHDRIRKAVEDGARGESSHFEAWHRVPSTDDLIQVETTVTPIFNDEHQVVYLVVEGADITKRKSAEEALKASERRLADIIDFLPDPTMVINQNGEIIIWNHAMETLTGVKSDDILGKDDYEYSIPFYGTKRPMLINLVLQPNKESEKLYSSFTVEDHTVIAEVHVPLLKPGGLYLWLKATPLCDEDGRVFGAIESLRDVTDRKLAEIALKESEEKFRALAENAQALIFIAQDSRYAYTNPYFSNLTGYTSEELVSMEATDIVHPEYRELVTERMHRRLMGGPSPANYEFAIIAKDGREILLDYSAARIEYRGKPAIVGVGYDVTERRKSEEEKRAFYRETILSATDGKLNICERSATKTYIENSELQECIRGPHDLGPVRRKVSDFCEEKGLAKDRLDSFVIGIGEGLDNALKHANEGHIYAGKDDVRIWVVIADRGPGIESIVFPKAVLRKGFSTKPSLGLGYSIMLQVSDQILLSTGKEGTTVVLIENLKEETNNLLDNLPDTWEGISNLHL